MQCLYLNLLLTNVVRFLVLQTLTYYFQTLGFLMMSSEPKSTALFHASLLILAIEFKCQVVVSATTPVVFMLSATFTDSFRILHFKADCTNHLQ